MGIVFNQYIDPITLSSERSKSFLTSSSPKPVIPLILDTLIESGKIFASARICWLNSSGSSEVGTCKLFIECVSSSLKGKNRSHPNLDLHRSENRLNLYLKMCVISSGSANLANSSRLIVASPSPPSGKGCKIYYYFELNFLLARLGKNSHKLETKVSS